MFVRWMEKRSRCGGLMEFCGMTDGWMESVGYLVNNKDRTITGLLGTDFLASATILRSFVRVPAKIL